MSIIRKTITVTNQQNSWIKGQIDAGKFTNDSEYIRALIRRDQESNAEIDTIRAKLIKAEQSGLSHRTPLQIRDEAKASLKNA